MEGGKITSASPVGDMTHRDGFTILDKYFEQSTVDLGSVSDVEGPGK
jgi:hypothetical protein